MPSPPLFADDNSSYRRAPAGPRARSSAARTRRRRDPRDAAAPQGGGRRRPRCSPSASAPGATPTCWSATRPSSDDPAVSRRGGAGRGRATDPYRAACRELDRAQSNGGRMTTDAPTAQTAAGQLDPRRWLALAVLGVAYLMVVLDVSIVNVALPSIQTDLDFSPENLQWVVSGYALTFGGFLLLGGRAGDVLGPAEALHDRARAASRSSRCCAPCPRPTTMLIVARAAPGRGLGAPRAVGLLDHAGHVPGGRRAQQGAGHPRRDRRRGRGHRRAARRRPHRVRRLGVGLLGQRARSACITLFFVPRFVRESRVEGMARNFDALGAVDRHGEPDAPGLRPHAGQPGRLDLGPRRSACCSRSAS